MVGSGLQETKIHIAQPLSKQSLEQTQAAQLALRFCSDSQYQRHLTQSHVQSLMCIIVPVMYAYIQSSQASTTNLLL